ncbi:MAG: hypothetical protein ACREJ3_18780 [Polyangiaceae bacterium]
MRDFLPIVALLGLVGVGAGVWGCAESPAMTSARRDILSASPSVAVALVREVLPCAHELDDVLADRMQIHDAAGASAALARIDASGMSPEDARRFLGDADDDWRAVGARGLVRPEDREARLRALIDPAPRVRREAARAARDAADPYDLGPLSEAARLDPAPIVRTEAVRSLAALPATPDGTVANALRDLFTGGDDGLREDIALAWSSPRVWSAGGKEALRVLVASGQGPAALEAAAAVLTHPDAGRELRATALARIAEHPNASTPAAKNTRTPPSLADPNPLVRVRAACALMMTARRRPGRGWGGE